MTVYIIWPGASGSMRTASFNMSSDNLALGAENRVAADEAKKPANPAKTSDQAAPTDEKAMMEAWAKVATPGEAHKWLEPVVGTWDAKITMWMTPGAPPQESTGTSENKWVLGGRFV